MAGLLLSLTALNGILAILSMDRGDQVWRSVHTFLAGACCASAVFTF
jgi:hypothetical protein